MFGIRPPSESGLKLGGWNQLHVFGQLALNKRVVEIWAKEWRKAQDDMEHWLKMTKQTEGQKKAAAKANEGNEFADSELDELDDLDDF